METGDSTVSWRFFSSMAMGASRPGGLAMVFLSALAEVVDPVHLAEQPHHHAEGMEHAEQQRGDDHAVEHRVGHEGAHAAPAG